MFNCLQICFREYVLVTGATGFIGAHVVDCLLSRGIRVRGTTRSLSKGEEMIQARSQYQGKLDFVQIDDFENTGVFSEAVKGVDAVIHVASVGHASSSTWAKSPGEKCISNKAGSVKQAYKLEWDDELLRQLEFDSESGVDIFQLFRSARLSSFRRRIL